MTSQVPFPSKVRIALSELLGTVSTLFGVLLFLLEDLFMIFFFRGSCWVSSTNAEVHQNRVVELDGHASLFDHLIERCSSSNLKWPLSQSYLRRNVAQSESGRGDPVPPEQSCGAIAEESGSRLRLHRPNAQVLETAVSTILETKRGVANSQEIAYRSSTGTETLAISQKP